MRVVTLGSVTVGSVWGACAEIAAKTGFEGAASGSASGSGGFFGPALALDVVRRFGESIWVIILWSLAVVHAVL